MILDELRAPALSWKFNASQADYRSISRRNLARRCADQLLDVLKRHAADERVPPTSATSGDETK